MGGAGRRQEKKKRQETRGRRQETRDKQPLSQVSMVCCRPDKDRRDASDGATFGCLLET